MTSNVNQFHAPRDILIEQVLITNFANDTTNGAFDVHDSVIGMNIQESIFENVMSGSVTVADAYGLPELMPFLGEETIHIKFRTDQTSDPFDKVFKVYKVSDVKQTSNNKQVYTLHFVSPEFLASEKVLVNKAYKGKTTDVIVKDLFNLLGSDRKLQTESNLLNLQQIVLGSLKPLAAMNLLTTYAYSGSHKASLFLFWEDATKFNFKSLEELFQADPKKTLKRQTQNTIDKKVEAESLNNIIDLRALRLADMLQAINSGMVSNTVKAIDLVGKASVVKSFSYDKQFKDTEHVDKAGQPLTSKELDYTSHLLKCVHSRNLRSTSNWFKSHSGEATSFAKTAEDTLPYRLSAINQINHVVYEAVVPGDTKLIVGDIVEVELPSFTYDKDKAENIFDRYRSGRYLVTQIDHVIVQREYVMKLRIARDVLGQAPGASA